MNRAHPILFAALITLMARWIGLARFYFGTDPQGNKLVASSLPDFVIAASFHSVEILMLGLIGYWVWLRAGRARESVTVCMLILFAVLTVVGQVDLDYQRYVGQRFSPGVFQTYVGPDLLDIDMYEPLLEEKGYLALSLGLMFGPWLLFLWIGIKRNTGEEGRERLKIWKPVGACAVCVLPLLNANALQMDLVRSPEALFVSSWFGLDRTPAPENEAQAVADLRSVIGGKEETWLSPDYPLVRQPGRGPALSDATASRPDIILFVVESLRGRDVGYGAHPRQPSPTPHLDRLAERSVVFPYYIANGDPSARGFFSINTSLWPHRERFAIANFTDLRVSSIPGYLKQLGYRNLILWGSNPSFDNQLAWARRWYDRLDYELPENEVVVTRRMSDRTIMDHLIGRIRDHDAAQPDQPLFAYVASTGTHAPYTFEDSYFVPLTAAGDANRVATGGIDDVQLRYDRVLQNLDFQIGRVIEFLKSRKRWHNTMILVVGDHAANTLDEVDPALQGMPVDFRVWTSALIYGPPELIGKPRQEPSPASHVDLMPTLLDLVGNRTPYASVGRNLFADDGREFPTAVAVREPGLRVDRRGHSLFVHHRTSQEVWTVPAFSGAAQPRKGVEGSPFKRQEGDQWRRRVHYLSYLMEHNRIWHPRFGESPPAS